MAGFTTAMPTSFKQELMEALHNHDDRVPALVQFREAQEPFANAGDGHLVQRFGGFLAIPGDEGDRGALGEKLGGGGDLPGLHFELARNLNNVCFVHFKTDLWLYPSAARATRDLPETARCWLELLHKLDSR